MPRRVHKALDLLWVSHLVSSYGAALFLLLLALIHPGTHCVEWPIILFGLAVAPVSVPVIIVFFLTSAAVEGDIALETAVLPIVYIVFNTSFWLCAYKLRPKRRFPLVCARCAYDLRATPERCPECGAVSGRGLELRDSSPRAERVR